MVYGNSTKFMMTLKELIKSKGYTTSSFALLTGLNVHTINFYASKRCDFIDTPVWLAVKIADALDVDIHELMKECEKNTDEDIKG